MTLKKQPLLSLLLAVLMVGAGLLGCGEKKDAATGSTGGAQNAAQGEFKSPEPRPAGQIDIPKSVKPEDGTMLAYARLREPNKLIDRMGAWVSVFNPQMTPDSLRQQMAQQGFDPSEFREGGNGAVFVWTPANPQMPQPAMGGYIPAAPESGIATTLKAQMGEQNVVPAEGGVAFAQTPDAMTKVSASLPALSALANAPASADLQLYAAMDNILAQYGMQLQQAMGMMSMMMAGKGQTPAAQQMMQAQMQTFQDGLNQMQSMQFMVNFDPEALELAAVVTAKEGSAMAGYLQDGPISAPDLTQYLMAPGLMRGQASMKDMAGMIELQKKTMAAYAATNPAAMQKLSAKMDEFAQMGKTDYGFSLNLRTEGGFVYEGLMQTEKSDECKEKLRGAVELINDPDVNKLYQDMGLNISAKASPDAREVNGYKVDHYDITIEPNEKMLANAKPEEQALLKKFFNNASLVSAQVGSILLFTYGAPIDDLLGRLLSGQGGQSAEAIKSFPAGGWLYLDVNVAEYARMMKQILPPNEAARIPEVPSGVPAMTFFGFHDQGQGYYRMQLPKGLITALKQPKAQGSPVQ